MSTNGFPGIASIESTHVGCEPAEGAPLPEVPSREPVLVTWRVVQRDTGACLRSGFEALTRFGQPHLFPDQIAEFSTEEAAISAISLIQTTGRFTRTVVLCAREVCHMAIDSKRLSSVLCRVRDTAVEQAWADMRLTHPTLRGLAGLSTKAGW